MTPLAAEGIRRPGKGFGPLRSRNSRVPQPVVMLASARLVSRYNSMGAARRCQHRVGARAESRASEAGCGGRAPDDSRGMGRQLSTGSSCMWFSNARRSWIPHVGLGRRAEFRTHLPVGCQVFICHLPTNTYKIDGLRPQMTVC
jgi:hypothetical protein